MSKTDRAKGRLIRTITKEDRAWRAEGQPEGKLENSLAMHLGRAARAGMGAKSREVQIRNAKARGERSGWER